MADDLSNLCEDLAGRSRAASRKTALLTIESKNRWLSCVAAELRRQTESLITANAKDLKTAVELGLSSAATDRLRLTAPRISAMAAGVESIALLADPIGRVLDKSTLHSGLRLRKVSVPLGVIFFIYESRPNVTIDAAALCVKSGNSVILRGGKEAAHSNAFLCRLLRDALVKEDLPPDAVQGLETTDRAAVGHLLKMEKWIDLVIPRGGESLIRRVVEESRIPVLKHYRGNCHIYIDRDADPEMAGRIVINAKCQRPGVCNAAESLVVHEDFPQEAFVALLENLRSHGVQVRGCERTRSMVPGVSEATLEDYATEYLDLIISCKIVGSIDEALDHISRFGSGHTEAIVTRDRQAAERFMAEVDAAAVFVNASTRFHDGFEFGFGAEIGISTDKIHARGPCGLVELTSYKYIVHGEGQIRGG